MRRRFRATVKGVVLLVLESKKVSDPDRHPLARATNTNEACGIKKSAVVSTRWGDYAVVCEHAV